MAATMMATPKSVTIVAAPIVSFLRTRRSAYGWMRGLLGQEPGERQAVTGHVEPGGARQLARPDEVGHAVQRSRQLDPVIEDVVDVPLDLEDRPQDPIQ